MKAIVFQVAHFRLPDDFHGGLADALRAMADYHERVTPVSEEQKQVLSDEIAEMPFIEANTALFDIFLDEVRNGKRFVGTAQIVSYDPVIEDLPEI